MWDMNTAFRFQHSVFSFLPLIQGWIYLQQLGADACVHPKLQEGTRSVYSDHMSGGSDG